MAFEWTNTFEIGHAAIDAHHKRLLALCTAVIEPLVDSAEARPAATKLQALIDFTQEHFSFEEQLMRSEGYPGLEQHAQEHASLLKELRAYSSKSRSGPDTDAVETMSFFWGWLNLHIDSTDRKLVGWLNARAPDGGR